MICWQICLEKESRSHHQIAGNFPRLKSAFRVAGVALLELPDLVVFSSRSTGFFSFLADEMYCSLYDNGMVQHDDHFTKIRQIETTINYKYPSSTKLDANKSHQHYHLPERLESQISCSHSLQHHLLERPQSAGPGKDVTKYIRNITKLVSSHSELDCKGL